MATKDEAHPRLHAGAIVVFLGVMGALALPTIRDIGWGIGYLAYAEYQDMVYFWDHWDTVKATLAGALLLWLIWKAATVPAYRSSTTFFN